MARVTKWKSLVSAASTRLARVRISPTSEWTWASVRRQARVSDINSAGPMPWLLTSPTTTPRQSSSMGM